MAKKVAKAKKVITPLQYVRTEPSNKVRVGTVNAQALKKALSIEGIKPIWCRQEKGGVQLVVNSMDRDKVISFLFSCEYCSFSGTPITRNSITGATEKSVEFRTIYANLTNLGV